ncbi:MAG: hypothetical protein E6Q27_05065 [Aeromicrobium sp.]|nr:MAG: hypothetical protein E6Q27_05065 [Aeromicrobium sp.]
MNESSEARALDEQISKAWLDFRKNLAERLGEALDEDEFDEISVSTPTGKTLTITVEDEHVIVTAGNYLFTTDHEDEAAFEVFQILTKGWEVVHPLFLDTELVEVPRIPDNPPVEDPVVVPVLGSAESREELQRWVEATFQGNMDEELIVSNNGKIKWSLNGPEPLVVQVRNEGRIELWTLLATEVDFAKAEEALKELSNKHLSYKFFLRQDRLVMSRTLNADPFVPKHLTDALDQTTHLANRLQDLRDKLLSARAKQDRLDVAAAQAAQAAAEAELAEVKKQRDDELVLRIEAEEFAEQAVARADRQDQRRRWAERKRQRAEEQRDAALAELALIKKAVGDVLGIPLGNSHDLPGSADTCLRIATHNTTKEGTLTA